MSPIETGLRRGITLLVTVMVPLILIMTSIRLLMTDAFLQVEYRSPGFPADPYGFTLDDRLHWSRLSVDYLLNNAGISFLQDLRFSDGTPIYNERELSHMLDVKNLVQLMLRVWALLLIVLVLVGILAWRKHWSDDFRRGLSRGGWLTVGLVVAILAAVAVSFTWLFTEFHRLFFVGNTWIFYYSDTLIRLFPLRFWQDGFILMGLFSLLGGAALGYFLRDRYGKKSVIKEAR